MSLSRNMPRFPESIVALLVFLIESLVDVRRQVSPVKRRTEDTLATTREARMRGGERDAP